MDVKNQLFYFLSSVLVGFIGGICYEFFAFFRQIFGCEKGKRKFLGIILDVIYTFGFGILWIYTSFLLKIPDFRIYMCIGWLIGGIIYAKTLRIILAIFKKMCYNTIARIIKKAKSKIKTLKKERI